MLASAAFGSAASFSLSVQSVKLTLSVRHGRPFPWLSCPPPLSRRNFPSPPTRGGVPLTPETLLPSMVPHGVTRSCRCTGTPVAAGQVEATLGVGIEWRLDNRFSWIDLDLDLDLDVDLDLHKQKNGMIDGTAATASVEENGPGPSLSPRLSRRSLLSKQHSSRNRNRSRH